MASVVIEELAASDDPVDRALAEALLKWQDDKEANGLSRSLGYEPRDIREKGSITVISERVRKQSVGFEEIDPHWSYEAIVVRYANKFPADVVNIAQERIAGRAKQAAAISTRDIQLIASARRQMKFADLTEDERTAYRTVSAVLAQLGERLRRRLAKPQAFSVKLTSGFNLQSGVRGGIPKDLWFSVSPVANGDSLAGMPQCFMIVSDRGIELGYGASVSPSDFSAQVVKDKVRAAAPIVFDQLPEPRSEESAELASRLASTGPWFFRHKHRLVANQSDFPSLDAWLEYLKSKEGKKNAAGTISRYILPAEVDGASLEKNVDEAAALFEGLLDRQWNSQGLHPRLEPAKPSENMKNDATEREGERGFADALQAFLRAFDQRRTGAFAIDAELSKTMRALENWLEQSPPVASRSNIQVKVSVGQGGWTKTPWIALLDDRETDSTRRGRYIVFLVAEDLSTTFLTLNQGMTDLVRSLGQRGAVNEMHRVADEARRIVPDMAELGFTLSADIDLRSATSAAGNYEEGTIAFLELPTENIPADSEITERLEALLVAYERVISAAQKDPEPIYEEAGPAAEPYTLTDALEDLFLEEAEIENLLSIWRGKHNLILQGAPGVGKSFVARRLAYLLLQEKDDHRIESVQFHQSYSYEDFVQGYRPSGDGGFVRKDGSFYRFCEQAHRDPTRAHVFLIDEINRGNLSKIFGELMLLIEADKRDKSWAVRLSYAADNDQNFFVPSNVYILGMMNTADRSLSLVDYALRRRFSFVTMQPKFVSPKFQSHLTSRGVPNDVAARIVERMNELNAAIAEDKLNLGPAFRIGHSFFMPPAVLVDAEAWYSRVVETEVVPLLDEYWFDSPETVDRWRARLLGA